MGEGVTGSGNILRDNVDGQGGGELPCAAGSQNSLDFIHGQGGYPKGKKNQWVSSRER